MTMLTQTGGSFESSAGRRDAPAVADHLVRIKQVCWFICNVLLAGGALAGTIALKTLAFVWRLHA
jgi:hypothetical protein